MSDMRFTRRRFLEVTGGLAAVVAAPSLLSACGGDGGASPSDAASANKAVQLPTYTPWEQVSPDLPATPDGVMAGFYSYPTPVDAFSSPPLAGAEPVEMLTSLLGPLPPAVGDNAYWQELNTRVGTELNVTMTPQADYPNKLATVFAGGDLPDIILINTTLANRSDVLTRLCADLTEYLSGDAVNEYPFLANIPADSWPNMVYGGGIYALPIPRAVVGTIFFSRADFIAERSLNPAPAGFAEFRELAEGLNDPANNRWAFSSGEVGNGKNIITFVGNMLGVPNAWKEEGGTFTSEHETEERKEAIARTAELVQAGLFHPDALGGKLQERELFGNGTLAFKSDGYAAWDILADTYPVEVGAVAAPKFDGGGPGMVRAGATSFGYTAFKQADPERIQQLLALCNWLAAPLGTSEFMFRKYGIEGTHYTMENGAPVRTPEGDTEVKVPLEYVADSPHVLGPRARDRVDAQRAYQEEAIPNVVRSAAEGLYSEASINKGGQLTKIVDDGALEILAGRQPIEYWDTVVDNWRRQGGDQIRTELEAAFAEAR
ncbi:extracellular solute-binding protein [Jiangella alkaliphila]|uniref:Putative aldouronate transport system substrate-binding protein n=1 Tax=Jiangella alkaliphila TaxID=419479 RepID=A0A1H2G1G8_9ACTN|nr:extracellular solute-binding protein [Jiangella alkaliphila]SDU13417.1 putative aldouronate transport system substrate-binding protein [Jiangella alkaliphila]